MTSLSEAPTSSPVSALVAVAWPRAGAPARGGPGNGCSAGAWSAAVLPGRGNLERVALAVVVRWPETRSHSASVTPSGWSMNSRSVGPETSASSTSTSGSTPASLASISVCRCAHVISSVAKLIKKAGERPLPVHRHRERPARKAVAQVSTAAVRAGRLGACSGRQASSTAARRAPRRGAAPGAVAVERGSRAGRAAGTRPAPAACAPRRGGRASAGERPRQNSA